jgi:hypothetical protein
VLILIEVSPHLGQRQPESMGMGTIIEFPADAASRRPGSTVVGAPDDGMGTVLILPVVRVERDSDGTSDDSGPEEGAASGGRRRRR